MVVQMLPAFIFNVVTWELGEPVLYLYNSQTELGKLYIMQTYTVSFTFENTYQLDSHDCKGGERSRTLKAQATSHVEQTGTCVMLLLPRCTFHTFLKNVCLFFNQVKRMNPKLHCVSQQHCADFEVDYFILCNVFFAQSSVFYAAQLKLLPFPVSIYVFIG